MKNLALVLLALACLCEPAAAQSCNATTRARVSAVTIFVCPNGSDSNDGMTESTPVKTLQWATDCAVSNFDFARRPGNWDYVPSNAHQPGAVGFIGRRPGPIVKLCAGRHTLADPLYFDGLGQTAPVWVQGDCGNPNNVTVNVTNQFQGFTSQHGGVLAVECMSITGHPNATMVNSLLLGSIAVGQKVQFIGGDDANHRAHAIGAAMLSSVDLIGPGMLLWGYFGSVMEAIEMGRIGVGNHPIALSANWDTLFVLGALSMVTTEGAGQQKFTGHGSGTCVAASRNSGFDFDPVTNMPCKGTYFSAGSWMFDNSGGLMVMGVDGRWR